MIGWKMQYSHCTKLPQRHSYVFSAPRQRVCVCLRTRLCAHHSMYDKEESLHCRGVLENAARCKWIVVLCNKNRRVDDVDLTASRHLECVSNSKLAHQLKKKPRKTEKPSLNENNCTDDGLLLQLDSSCTVQHFKTIDKK